MTRADYYRLRSAARQAERRLDLSPDSISIFRAEALGNACRRAWKDVPGGKTFSYHYTGTCLLREWHIRRLAVQRKIASRHRAERQEAA